MHSHVVNDNLVAPFTRALVTVSAALVNLCGGNVLSVSSILAFVEGPGEVQVSNGCNAVEVSILIAAAVLAYPARLSARVVGAVLSVAIIQAINLLRIISLLFLSWYSQSGSTSSIYVWDALIVATIKWTGS